MLCAPRRSARLVDRMQPVFTFVAATKEEAADQLMRYRCLLLLLLLLLLVMTHLHAGAAATNHSSSKGQPCRSRNFHHASHPKLLTIPQLCLDHFRHEFVEAACEAPSVVCF
jgi:hypothetical protein